MASRCEHELGKEKRKACIVIRTDNECSTDEQVMHCCSIKGIKELLPVLNRNNNNNNINKKYFENILQSKEHLDNYMQIYHCKTEQDSLNKKGVIKQDERMYDLAHLLFKISDLSLKVTEYEKIHCVKETDLRKMLNIVKVEIMKSFLKGKTKYETMNKIILRLMYLDEIIKEMYESKVDCSDTKIIYQNTIKTNIDKKQCTQINKKQTIKNNEMTTIKTINPKETIYTDNNSIDEITIAPTSSNLTAIFNGIVPQNTLRKNNNYSLSGKKINYSFKNDHESVISNKNLKLSQRSVKSSKSCYMTHNRSDYDKQTLNNKTIRKSIRKDRKQHLKLIDEYVQTDFDKLSTIERYSAATSYEDIYINPNRSMPNIGANQLWKQRHIPKLNPKDWVEIDGNMEMIEIPVDKLNKQISAQKLKKIDDNKNSENVENNAQTDDILLTESGDYQIVSMTILYSKTHARYIIPNWKPIDYNIDERPKVLSKQDLDDGMALTSYKADQDGTIHFTLTFANNELSNVNNGDVTTKKLVKQLKEIRGLWAESARILYNTLVEEYDEQNIKVEFTNYDTQSNKNKNNKVEEIPNLESSFVSSNPYSNY